jgi:hypothetical protein
MPRKKGGGLSVGGLHWGIALVENASRRGGACASLCQEVMSMLCVYLTTQPKKMSFSPLADTDIERFIQEQAPFREIDEESACCVSEQVYLDHDRSKWKLFTMLVGIKDDSGRVLGDTELSPYKEMKLRKNLVPTSKNYYREEIERRSFLYSIEEPKCKFWNKDRLMAWLKENPIPDGTDGQERMWLISEESNIHKMLSAAAAEREATAPL